MKTNIKFIGIITLILFIVPTGLTFSFAQNGGYYENDYGNYQAGTRVEINNYYGNRISYTARINRFHRTYVNIDYYTPYYVDYYSYYTPFMNEWSYYSPVDYYFGVNVFYTPWRSYYRPRFYSAYWSYPVYYNSYYYNSCRNVPVYYQSAYYGYPSKKYRMNWGYYSSHKSYKHNNYGVVNRNYYSAKSTNNRETTTSGIAVNQNRSRKQSNSVAISNKRRSQNHYVSNKTSNENQARYRTTARNATVKTKYASGRRPSGNRYAVTNRNKNSVHKLPATKTYGNRRSTSGSLVKAKKVTTGRPGAINKTGNRHFVAQKTSTYSNRRSAVPGRSQSAVRSNTRSKQSSAAGKVVRKKSEKTTVVTERRRR